MEFLFVTIAVLVGSASFTFWGIVSAILAQFFCSALRASINTARMMTLLLISPAFYLTITTFFSISWDQKHCDSVCLGGAEVIIFCVILLAELIVTALILYKVRLR
jgi:hypothetical protein